jgi:hypothetical protein
MSDLHDMADPELKHAYDQARWTSRVADVMALGGARAGAGDVWHALNLLGLELRPAGDSPVPDVSDLTEVRQCPKCGTDQVRRTDVYGQGWYHEREDWGFQRGCLS